MWDSLNGAVEVDISVSREEVLKNNSTTEERKEENVQTVFCNVNELNLNMDE